MRLSIFDRHLARRPTVAISTLTILTALLPSLSRAFNFTAAPSANLDFSRLGRIGIAGNFDGISLFEFEEQAALPLSKNGSESLLTALPNGALASLGDTDATIRAMCPVKLSDGTVGVVLGGNFTSLDGTKSTAIALFNTNSSQITPLDGLQGEVNALLCDQGNGTVYVGGNFKGGNSTNAIAWLIDGSWTNLPFAGFNGPVHAITKASNGHVIFGGSFTGLGNVSAPNAPDGQAINLSTANITAVNSATTSGFSDPKNVVCSDGTDGSGKTWLVADNTPAVWDAAFNFGFEPTKLRLWNTHENGRGTKTFRFIALPINGIMNFTYIDPVTGKNSSCTAECPLSNDPKVPFQDFHFVNRVGMNQFQVSISAWYGSGAGLNGIELFEDNIFSYAIKEFNEPSCGGVEFPSSATTTGPWTTSPSLQSDSQYLTAKLTGPVSSKSASVVFSPNILEAGNYSINMYTPGCMPDNTCATRGRVNITGIMSSGSIQANFSTSLYQTNNFDKYDQIYFGFIDQTSEDFKPTLTITPLDGQGLDEMTIVAQKVGFTLINGTGGLNGLYDFDPSKAVVNTTDLSGSAINKLGAGFDHASGVKALATVGDVTYIGGNFTSDKYRNLVAINTNKKIVALDGGLNGQVLDMYLDGTDLYLAGEFTNKRTNEKDGLSYATMYDTKSSTWSALGAGVDGHVRYVEPFQLNISHVAEVGIAFSGSFTQIKAFGDFAAVPAQGFAIWVPSRQNWLPNLDISVPSYGGRLTSSLLNVTGTDCLYGGSMSSSELSVNGAATLSQAGLGQFPVDIQAAAASSNKRRRDISDQVPVSGVVTGGFYNGGNANITVLAGHFSAEVNGSTVSNLIFMDGKNKNAVSGIGDSISAASTFTTLDFQGSTLFAGGNISGTINDNQVTGLLAYDVVSKTFTSPQPAPVSGGGGVVSVVSVRQESPEVYVAGTFTKAGALDCPGVCLYDTNSQQWSRPGNSLGGVVTSLLWASKTLLIAAGNMTANGTDATFMAMYDAKKRSWQNFPGADQIPGPVEVMTAASFDNTQVWISGHSPNGTVYIMKYDGSHWKVVPQTPPSGSVVQSLQVFSLTQAHNKVDILDDSQVLMLTGSIPIPAIGSVSAVIYNGTHYQPYALTNSLGSGSGNIARIFTQNNNFFKNGAKHMPLVFVVLIGLAVSLALIVLLVLAGIILDRIRKKREGYTPAPTSMYDRGSGIQRIPPRELLEEMQKTRPGAAPHV